MAAELPKVPLADALSLLPLALDSNRPRSPSSVVSTITGSTATGGVGVLHVP